MDITNKIKPAVPKRVLFFVAAFVWGLAASRIIQIGFTDVLNNVQSYWINISLGIVGFFFFFRYVFYKIYVKNTRRIVNSKQDKPCIFSFFDIKGYLIMAFMITVGITFRKINLIPAAYLGTFYIMLGLSLLLAALSFLYSGVRYDYMIVKYCSKENAL